MKRSRQSEEEEEDRPIVKKTKFTLSKEQADAIHRVIDKKESVFITGLAGCGKTFGLNHMIEKAQEKWSGPGEVFVLGTTGQAAYLINGKTIESAFGIDSYLPKDTPIDRRIHSCNIRRKAKRAPPLRNLKIMFIDEVSMLDPKLLDFLDEYLRIVFRNNLPFGGVIVVLVGDPYQLPPIGTDKKFFHANVFNKAFPPKQRICFVDQHRQEGDWRLQYLLLTMRTLHITSLFFSLVGLLEVPFSNRNLLDDGIAPMYVETHLVDIDEGNEKHLKSLNQTIHTFEAKDNWTPWPGSEKLFPLPKHVRVCKGLTVMCTKNLDETITNGSMGKVVGFEAKTLLEQIICSGQSVPKVVVDFMNGERRVIKAITMKAGHCTRRQIPLATAHKRTAHKAQGMTVDKLESDVSKTFASGMCFIICSRVRAFRNLHIRGLLDADRLLERLHIDQDVIDFMETIVKRDSIIEKMKEIEQLIKQMPPPEW
jgi:ATP-dependent DNA helicase PIF1